METETTLKKYYVSSFEQHTYDTTYVTVKAHRYNISSRIEFLVPGDGAWQIVATFPLNCYVIEQEHMELHITQN